ncbi:hypothetical protein HHL25_17155 [Rhizobium sp. S-51]|uniref:Uncharacterized protein n=1 Tax=Rhizobium terricola TaxID=2728849 RepID=A0A7Y0AYN0_9HYPH|nr:hypothetical protein [Rhizobium terricola]NML75863.1 hypothetical protein [Rhizobium terricola]
MIEKEELQIYRLLPSAPLTDPNWQNVSLQGEVVVRARSTGDARLVASEAETDFRDIGAKPAEDVSTSFASAFRNEKLYTVVLDTSGRYPADGERGIVAGQPLQNAIAPLQR